MGEGLDAVGLLPAAMTAAGADGEMTDAAGVMAAGADGDIADAAGVMPATVNVDPTAAKEGEPVSASSADQSSARSGVCTSEAEVKRAGSAGFQMFQKSPSQ